MRESGERPAPAHARAFAQQANRARRIGGSKVGVPRAAQVAQDARHAWQRQAAREVPLGAIALRLQAFERVVQRLALRVVGERQARFEQCRGDLGLARSTCAAAQRAQAPSGLAPCAGAQQRCPRPEQRIQPPRRDTQVVHGLAIGL